MTCPNRRSRNAVNDAQNSHHRRSRSGARRHQGIFAEPTGSAEFGEACTGAEALKLVRERDWDIAVLDISLGGRSGLEVLKEIKQLHPRLPVLILSMHAEEQYAMRAFKAGASGYISKGSSRDELRAAILKVIKGGRYVSPSLAEKMVVDLSTSDKLPHETLSDRELEVLCLIAFGQDRGRDRGSTAFSERQDHQHVSPTHPR